MTILCRSMLSPLLSGNSASLVGQPSYSGNSYYSTAAAATTSASLTLNTNGTWTITSTVTGTEPKSGTWYIGAPPVTFYVRFTARIVNTASGSVSYTASTSWLALSAARSISVATTAATPANCTVTYDVEISSSATGPAETYSTLTMQALTY